jgi:Cu2+-exporting ATPase
MTVPELTGDPESRAKPPTAPFAHPLVEERFTRSTADGSREAFLLIDGIRCGACALNVEHSLQRLAGVSEAEVNFSTHRARVVWDGSRLKLFDILAAVLDSGYGARPYDPSRRESGIETERRRRLRHLGIAGLFGMQVMAISLALYAGDFYGIEGSLQALLRWASLVLVIPVLLYAASSFFLGAAADLRHGRTGMDVPVALGLVIAFAGSVHATFTGAGAVYFDSVSMFVFFLLLARYVEFSARARHARIAESLVTAPPPMATRLRRDGRGLTPEAVPAATLVPEDLVIVACGETVAADGVVAAGRSTLDESLLTGESRPVQKAVGDSVVAGSVNFENPLEIRVTRTAEDSLLATTLRLMERARAAKPPAERMADRVAGGFVAAVLLLAAIVALYWWHAAPDRWLPITVSVLVITCPCALSLATPAALTSAIGALTKFGLIVTRGHVLENLARANRFVFDKTGTLTQGKLELSRVEIHANMDEECAVRIAAAIEQNLSHPVARSIRSRCLGAPAEAKDIAVTPGRGAEGSVDGKRYFIGSSSFISDRLSEPRPPLRFDVAHGDNLVVLADESGVLATFLFRDELRSDASELVEHLRSMGFRLSVLSGDRPQTAELIASRLDIQDSRGGLLPEQKLAAIQRMQAAGDIVAVVGDGINDAPLLAGADISFAMAGGPEAARASADLILIGNALNSIAASVSIARRTRAVIAQNIVWAVAYNLLALPAAALGFVPPWLAAIGMSLSSLIVVGNGLRAGSSSFPLRG